MKIFDLLYELMVEADDLGMPYVISLLAVISIFIVLPASWLILNGSKLFRLALLIVILAVITINTITVIRNVIKSRGKIL